MIAKILQQIGITFSELITLIIVLVLSVIAVKITIAFDVNKYLADRRKNNLNKLRNACTHHQVIKDGDKYGIQSLFVSPPGTLMWQCQQCGASRYFSGDELERMTKYYLDNFEEFTKQQKKFQKLLRKNKLT